MKKNLLRIIEDYSKTYKKYRSNIGTYIDILNRFFNFIKDIVSNVEDLKLKHFQIFIDNKSKNCNINTIKQYIGYLKAIIRMINITENISISDKIEIPNCKNTYMKNKAMSDKDIDKLLSTYNDHWHFAPVSIILSRKLGLRVSECTKITYKDINLNEKTIMINCAKNKNKVKMKIENNDFDFFKTLKDKLNKKKFLSVKPKSINNNIRKHLNLCGLNEKYKITNIHSIRKNFAQRMFDNYRTLKFNTNESLKKVSLILRHNIFCYKIIYSYVLNIY